MDKQKVVEELKAACQMIGRMCETGTPPKMSIPARPDVDEDIRIVTAIQNAIALLSEPAKEVPGLDEWLQSVTRDEYICPECDIVPEHIRTVDVIDYITALVAQKDAEIKELRAEVARRESERNEVGALVDKLYMMLAYRDSAAQSEDGTNV